jgi:GDP-L-fucose synthase
VEAKRSGAPSVVCWGTGEASREFLYVDDCAEGILLATERYDGGEPVNLGTGVEVTIQSLMESVKNLVGYAGRIEWDAAKPEGQKRRYMDVSKAKRYFGFKAATDMQEGLKKTIRWYMAEEQGGEK